MDERAYPRVIRSDARLRPAAAQTDGVVREQAFATDGRWVGIVVTEPGEMSAWHHHGDHDTYAYVLSGTKLIEHGPGGARSLRAGPGDFIHVPKGVVHREGNPSAEISRSVAFRVGTGPPLVNVEGPDPRDGAAGER